MRRTGLPFSWSLIALVGALSCGDGDPPEETGALGIGSVRGPISDWPDQRVDAGSPSDTPPSDPSAGEPPLEPDAMDAGVDFGGVVPPRDAGRPAEPAARDAANSENAQDAAAVEADAGDAGPAEDGGLADAASDAGATLLERHPLSPGWLARPAVPTP